MAVKLDRFFEALAERLSKENHLSDITYALCQSDKVFLQFFLDFFFGVIRFHIGVVGCGKLAFGIPAFFER